MNEENEDYGATGMEIAVIGMAVRFPGAADVDRFWENLKNGVNAVSFFSDEELLQEGVEAEVIQNPDYVKAKGVCDQYDHFDASFFGYSKKEAEILDPQARVFHECAWEALENSGYSPDSYSSLIGLYAGASSSSNWEVLSLISGNTNNLGFLASIMVDKDYLCSRVAYTLNLKGPCVSVRTTCSTSLVAVHLAIQGLLSGECDMALAGGVTIGVPTKRGYLHQEGMFDSPDGYCRAFDIKGKGFVGGNGAGIVVLKRLEDAMQDRDHIYAVVRGSAINNDGSRKVGYTAPSVEGQAEVISAAQLLAEVEPESISYIEAHGTATPLGDPIEVEALKRAFATDKKNFCALGSVKTNVGHMDSASGIAGFIKTALALKNRQIPPSLHFRVPNPQLELIDSPFYVNARLQEWEHLDYPLRAGVSSFGIGGTNAHVVLEEAPQLENPSQQQPAWHLLLLSAATPPALQRAVKKLALFLQHNPAINLADAAFTLLKGRKVFKYKTAVVCSNVEEAVENLMNIEYIKGITKTDPAVIFYFPRQSLYKNMGLELYRQFPHFRAEMDRCFDFLRAEIGFDIKNIFYPDKTLTSLPVPEDNAILHPFLFILQYALARQLTAWGIKPTAVMAGDIGEYVAAHTTGLFSLEHALSLVVLRGRLVQQLQTEPLMKQSALDEFREKLNQVVFNPMTIPYVDSENNGAIIDHRVADPLYWENNLKDAALTRDINDYQQPENTIIVELTLEHTGEKDSETHHLLEKIATLWSKGITVDSTKFELNLQQSRTPLPTYPFERVAYKTRIPSFLNSFLRSIRENGTITVEPEIAISPPARTTDRELSLPQQDIEQKMSVIIKDHLGIPEIDLDASFSQLAFDSLKIIIIGIEIFKEFNIRIPLDQMFEVSSIRELSRLVAELKGQTTIESGPFNAGDISGRPRLWQNMLLTGATGFLGSHMLQCLLDQTDAHIYCIIRGETQETVQNRGKEILAHYFEQDYAAQVGKRLFFLKGDITKSRLGLQNNLYDELAETIDTIVHSAADVRHYGRYEEFKITNVDGTRNLIAYCSSGKKKTFHYISTIGVSGEPPRSVNFREWDLDIGQQFDGNVYGRSKFEAESLVARARTQGLDASVYRVGNLVGRNHDGVFQKNIETNQLYSDLKALIHLGKYPGSLEQDDIEITPVDLCSKALVNLVSLKDAVGYNFHLMNPYRISYQTLLQFINQFGFNLQPVDLSTFSNDVYRQIKSGDFVKEISGIFYRIRNEDENPEEEFQQVTYDCTFTRQVLEKTGFSWPSLGFDYISKMLQHGVEVGYFVR